MSGLFGIINIGLTALFSHRDAISVRSHNLANVDTPGYSRQEARLATNPSLPPAGTAGALLGGQFGTGVHIATVRRARETFLSVQARICDGALGRWQSAAGALREVESVLAPAPGEDLSTLLDHFWNSWEAVANRPEDLSLRSVLLADAATLASTFNDYTQRLQSIRLSADIGIRARVEEVNDITAQVAEYNRQISVALAEQRAPNDLYDSRDLLLDRLSQLVGAIPVNSEAAHLIVYLDGRPLIQGAMASPLSIAAAPGGIEISTTYDGAPVRISNGEIGGLLDARDVVIPAYLDQLDTIAATLVAEVNALHQTGFGLDGVTGRDFFLAGGTAGDIALDPVIAADRSAVAAAAVDAPGDGSIALQIAALRTTPVLGSGQSLNDMARSLIGLLGNDIATCDNATKAQQFAADQIRQQQQSVSGVSIDEELSYLALSQRAYEAAARIITTADRMLAIILEEMGVS